MEVSQAHFNWKPLAFTRSLDKDPQRGVLSWSFLGSVRVSMAGFSVSFQNTRSAAITLVPLCSLAVLPLTGGGGGGRMWTDATLVCCQTVAGGMESEGIYKLCKLLCLTVGCL